MSSNESPFPWKYFLQLAGSCRLEWQGRMKLPWAWCQPRAEVRALRCEQQQGCRLKQGFSHCTGSLETGWKNYPLASSRGKQKKFLEERTPNVVSQESHRLRSSNKIIIEGHQEYKKTSNMNKSRNNKNRFGYTTNRQEWESTGTGYSRGILFKENRVEECT